jgi:ABC-type glycerol-3-phosphate transport system permease component
MIDALAPDQSAREPAAAPSERAPWMEKPSLLATIARNAVLMFVVVIVALPFVSVLATSFAGYEDILQSGGLVLFPLHPTLKAYSNVLQNGNVSHAILVSVGVTLVGTFVSVTLTTAMAYGLSRSFRGSRVFLFTALFTLLFVPGIVPSYLVVKQLGLLNNYASLIAPVAINAFNLVVLRQFFMAIPRELTDSARVDGAGNLRILMSIVLPLSTPALAVVSLFYAVSYWNAYFNALLYLNEPSTWPLQLIVRLYVLQGVGSGQLASDSQPLVAQSVQMAVVIVATLPILVVYPFLQRYFTKGVLTGAIKG